MSYTFKNCENNDGLEELAKVIEKYWPHMIQDITSTSDGKYESITLGFDFIDNNSDTTISTGQLVFWRPQSTKNPCMIIDVLSAADCERRSLMNIHDAHFMDINFPLE